MGLEGRGIRLCLHYMNVLEPLLDCPPPTGPSQPHTAANVVPHRFFVGQGGARGKKGEGGGGMKQAEQKAVLAEFRAGSFNTLVATCIGEEGLDIPEVCL